MKKMNCSVSIVEDDAITRESLRSLVDSDEQARDLFEQMRQLDRACQDAIQTQVLQSDRPVEDLITGAWEDQISRAWTGRVKRLVFSQFAYGLAAGLLVAVSLHLAMTALRPTAVSPVRVGQPFAASSGRAQAVTAADEEDALPQVNVYYYRDSQGNLWAIPALSEQRVLTAAEQRVF